MMLKKICLVLWVLAPIGAYLYQSGAGSKFVKADKVAIGFSQAARLIEQEDWENALLVLQSAQALVAPDDVRTHNRLRLETSKLYLRQGLLDKAQEELESIRTALRSASVEQVPEDFRRDVQQVQANADFYTAWQMRVQGEARTDWEPVLESARQSYRQLAETATTEEARTARSSDTESAIRLAFLDDDSLIGTPFPKQCQCKKKCNAKKRSEKPGKPDPTSPPKDGGSLREADGDTSGT